MAHTTHHHGRTPPAQLISSHGAPARRSAAWAPHAWHSNRASGLSPAPTATGPHSVAGARVASPHGPTRRPPTHPARPTPPNK
eukprot:2271035-Prymnesium_polylepis.1